MSKKWKRSFVTALSMALAVGNCVPAMAAPAGWTKDASGWRYVNSNGTVQKGWFQDTNKQWYFLDYNTGVMKTGWIKPKDGKWYFMDYHTGAMKTGWIKPMDGKWYYLDGASGEMKTGWVQTADKKWYYMDAASGAMKTGTITVDNKVYTLDANGVWNGESGKSTTYVSTSSSSRGSSSGSNITSSPSTITGDGWTATKDGDVTITEKGTYTPKNFTDKNVNKIKSLTIDKSVGDEDVTLEGLTVDGPTTINGGGSNTVTFNKCNLKAVKANKTTGNQGLHINFGAGTKVEGTVDVAGSKGVKLTIDSSITIKSIITTTAIEVLGGGKVMTFTVATVEKVILINVNITDLKKDLQAGEEADVEQRKDATIANSDVKFTPSITGITATVSGASITAKMGEDGKTATMVSTATGSAVGAKVSIAEVKVKVTTDVAGAVDAPIEGEIGKTINVVYKPTDTAKYKEVTIVVTITK